METIKLLYSATLMHDISREEKKKLHPEQCINAHNDENQNVRYACSSNLEVERALFNSIFLKLYEKYHLSFFKFFESEDEAYHHAYVLYIAYLYKELKEVPIEYITFRKWFMDEFHLQHPTIEYSNDAEWIETFFILDKGERLIRYAYLIKEAIERCTNPSVPLAEQKEVVQSVINCFQIRYEREVDNLNIGLLLTGMDLEKVLNGIFIQAVDNEGVNTYIGCYSWWQIRYDDADYPRWLREYKNLDEETTHIVEDDEVKDSSKAELQVEMDENTENLINYSQHYHLLKKHLLKHDMDGCIFQQNEHELLLLQGNYEVTLRFGDGKFYRLSGEEIYNLDALVHEIIRKCREEDEERAKIEKRAKEHLFNFLKENQRQSFDSNGHFVIEGIQSNYLIHKNKNYNNIIRFDKHNNKNGASLCITPNDVCISEYDVLATIVLLVTSGQEEIVNKTANEFPLTEDDRRIMEKALKTA